MSHAVHTGPEGTIWHDGCPECDRRAEQLPDSINDLDDERRLLAWKGMRNTRWTGGERPRHTVSANDAKLFDCLYAIAVFLERMGIRPDEVSERGVTHLYSLLRRAEGMGLEVGGARDLDRLR